MEYKGIKVHEANRRDYKLGQTSKRMIVWNNGDKGAEVRDVFGYSSSRLVWVAQDSSGLGVCDWDHAAEIPTEETLPKQKLNNRAN